MISGVAARTSAPLKNGDVIPVNRTPVPPDINGVVETLNTGLRTYALTCSTVPTAMNTVRSVAGRRLRPATGKWLLLGKFRGVPQRA
jgi:ABC-type transporter Mla subunit MlaD